jgi:tRNA A37 methylthiotransferase MiaB
VIVAFPGETDAQYRRTLALIEEIGELKTASGRIPLWMIT